ncbi:MAG TPA: hypothetical protein VM262_16785 [Acidimicrobiales bacterium]|nr:hypothetical protein [Acidimicrobiales bacterium]
MPSSAANAFKHMSWAALLGIRFDYKTAKGFLDRHEDYPGAQDDPARVMDTWNNMVGLDIGVDLWRQGYRDAFHPAAWDAVKWSVRYAIGNNWHDQLVPGPGTRPK